MPIRPENLARYPINWREISDEIRFERAGGRCECHGECGRPEHNLDPFDGRCKARHGSVTHITRSKVILTVAHLDHTPENCDPDNLRAMCQGCHLHYDREHHAETARATRAAALAAQMDPLPGLQEVGAVDWPIVLIVAFTLAVALAAVSLTNHHTRTVVHARSVEQVPADCTAAARAAQRVMKAQIAREAAQDAVASAIWHRRYLNARRLVLNVPAPDNRLPDLSSCR